MMRNLNQKKTSFDKKEHWDTLSFFHIYIDNNCKYIEFTGATDRVPQVNQSFLSWAVTKCENCKMILSDFLEWSVYYQKQKLFDDSDNETYIYEPQIAYSKANELVKADGNGSDFMQLINMTDDIPVGYYYGY